MSKNSVDIPTNEPIFKPSSRDIQAMSRRDLTVASASGGGYLRAIDNVSFIELLRNRMVVRQMAVRMLSGLVGNVLIPKQTAAATGYWLADENDSDYREPADFRSTRVGAANDRGTDASFALAAIAKLARRPKPDHVGSRQGCGEIASNDPSLVHAVSRHGICGALLFNERGASNGAALSRCAPPSGTTTSRERVMCGAGYPLSAVQLAAGRKQTSNMPCGTHPVQAFAATDTGRAASRSDGLQCRVQQCHVQYAAQQFVIMTTRNLDARSTQRTSTSLSPLSSPPP